MVMGYVRFPRKRMYWSSNLALRLGIVANNMSVNRFEAILSCLHFQNNLDHDATSTDRLWKLWPFLDMLAENFKRAVDPD